VDAEECPSSTAAPPLVDAILQAGIQALEVADAS